MGSIVRGGGEAIDVGEGALDLRKDIPAKAIIAAVRIPMMGQ